MSINNSIVRQNLLSRYGYTPYCGEMSAKCSMPRTTFNGEQFACPECGWVSAFPEEFIEEFKGKQEHLRLWAKMRLNCEY